MGLTKNDGDMRHNGGKFMDLNFLKGIKVLITGAAGLMGTHTLLRLKDLPDVFVRAVIHDREPFVRANNITYVKANLTKSDDCERVVEGMDYILMFAAKIDRQSLSWDSIFQTLEMNTQMMKAAYNGGAKKYLWLSSATGYPPASVPITEDKMFRDDPHDSHFVLGWTVRYIEKLCEAYALKMRKTTPVIVLRPTTIYGPWGDFEYATSHVLSALVRRVVERQNPLEIWGTGDSCRDFIYVDDVVDACFLALERIDRYDVFNIGSGRANSVKELLSIILEIENFADARVVFDGSKPAKAPALLVDCRHAEEVLGFKSKISLGQGLKKTISWLRHNGVDKKIAHEKSLLIEDLHL